MGETPRRSGSKRVCAHVEMKHYSHTHTNVGSESAPYPFNKNDFHVYFISTARYSVFNGVYFIDIGSSGLLYL